MPKGRPPYPAEFRARMLELVRSGRTPEELSSRREFGEEHIVPQEPSAVEEWADSDARQPLGVCAVARQLRHVFR